jgi:Na+/proline symporter
MRLFLKVNLITLSVLALPIIIQAQTTNPGTQPATLGILGIVNQLQTIIGAIVPLLIGVAVVVLFWGIIQYIFTADKEKGKHTMIWGIVALFVMTSVWGLVNILRSTLLGSGISNSPTEIQLPGAPRR